MKKLLLLTAVIAFVALHSQAQNTDSIVQIPSAYLDNVTSKTSQLQLKLDRKSEKALQQMQKLEQKMMGKLRGRDSIKAKEIFGDAAQRYKELGQRLEKGLPLQQYLPSLDTAVTALKFLQQNPQFVSSVKDGGQRLSEALNKVKRMEGEFQKADEIRKWMRERKQYLKEGLLNLGFAKELKKLNKQLFYYSAQLNEYKELLKDHRKAERKALELLSKSSLFQKFFRKNSHLASLFRMPAEPDDPVNVANLSGLQTRASVNALIQNQLSSGGPNAQQQLQQNIQQAQSELNRLKDKVNQAGGGSSDEELPDFKINNQRKKNFWKKWGLGVNTQSNKPNSFFPVTTDISMMAGFRPHDNYVVGVGIGGLIGWGRDIRHIEISSQGMNIKSFAEIKIRGSLHFAAGYEMNYRSEIRNIEQLKDRSVWQYSGLAGLSKVVSLKTKFFKKTKLQLMWDFLSYEQVPRTQALIFRVNYNIK